MKIKTSKRLRIYSVYRRDMSSSLHRYKKKTKIIKRKKIWIKRKFKKRVRRKKKRDAFRDFFRSLFSKKKVIGKKRVRRRRKSRFGRMLRRKIRLRRYYSFRKESQFATFMGRAIGRSKTYTIRDNAIGKIFGLFESKLDVFLVRINFFRTVSIARHMIRLGNVYVNGQAITFPNFLLKLNDVVNIKLVNSIRKHVWFNVMRRGFYKKRIFTFSSRTIKLFSFKKLSKSNMLRLKRKLLYGKLLTKNTRCVVKRHKKLKLYINFLIKLVAIKKHLLHIPYLKLPKPQFGIIRGYFWIRCMKEKIKRHKFIKNTSYTLLKILLILYFFKNLRVKLNKNLLDAKTIRKLPRFTFKKRRRKKIVNKKLINFYFCPKGKRKKFQRYRRFRVWNKWGFNRTVLEFHRRIPYRFHKKKRKSFILRFPKIYLFKKRKNKLLQKAFRKNKFELLKKRVFDRSERALLFYQANLLLGDVGDNYHKFEDLNSRFYFLKIQLYNKINTSKISFKKRESLLLEFKKIIKLFEEFFSFEAFGRCTPIKKYFPTNKIKFQKRIYSNNKLFTKPWPKKRII
jgi:ribosomal protein S4